MTNIIKTCRRNDMLMLSYPPQPLPALRPLMARHQPITEQRTTSRNLRVLTHLFGFLRPYRKNLAAALLALFIVAGALPGFGVVLQRLGA